MPDGAPPQNSFKLAKPERERFAALYRTGWRTLFRWVEIGEKAGDPCPLAEPANMPAWWSRHMVHRVPAAIEEAAIAALRSPAPEALGPNAESPAAAAPSASSSGNPPPPSGPRGPSIDLESFDPEEGDRLRELKQIQAAKFAQLRDALKRGDDCTILEGKYLKLSETIDKIESRVIERLKKRELYILRSEVERDLAANAELIRQLDQSQKRRVLERVVSLTPEQREEVAVAIDLSNRAKERILSRVDSLTSTDLLAELAPAA